MVVRLSRLFQADRSDSDQSLPVPRSLDPSVGRGPRPRRRLVVPTTPSTVCTMHTSRAGGLLAWSSSKTPLELEHGTGDFIAHAGLAAWSGGCCAWCATCAGSTVSSCRGGSGGSRCSGLGAEEALPEGGLCAHGTRSCCRTWVFHGCDRSGDGSSASLMTSS
jgi:hypothetical protein